MHSRKPTVDADRPGASFGPAAGGGLERSARETRRSRVLSYVRLKRHLALLLMFSAGCAGMDRVPPPASERIACRPDFAYHSGWLGGDGAHSIADSKDQPANRAYWMFGDSFVAASEGSARSDATMIHNSIGRSRCTENGDFEIVYEWPRAPDGTPRAVFESDRADHYVWPGAGFMRNGRLYVVLAEVRAAKARGSLGMPFVLTGSLLARVTDPHRPVAEWTIDLARLSDTEHAIPSVGLAIDGDFLHLFGFSNAHPDHLPRFLVRLPLSALDDWPTHPIADQRTSLPADGGPARSPMTLAGNLETWTREHEWEKGFLPGRADILMRDNASEMSVHRQDETGLWVAVYGSPVQTADDGTPSARGSDDDHAIFARSASRLTGPWSRRRLVHLISRHQPDPAGNEVEGDPDAQGPAEICYASKAHARLSPATALVLTYVCSVGPDPGGDQWEAVARLWARMDLYRPRTVIRPRPLPFTGPPVPLDSEPLPSHSPTRALDH